MPPLNELQREFARAVLAPDRAIPAGLWGLRAGVPGRRFAVYRNNVHASLIDVLQGRFPVVARLVGEEFFRAMAREFVPAQPPANPVLMAWGGEFPGFLAGYGPVQDLPYLPDVARLEWAWNEAYHAADAEPAGPSALAAVAPEEAGRLVFEMHPSLRLIRSSFPILTIWDANRAEGEVPPVDLGRGGEDVLVLRPALTVEMRRLPPGAAGFIEALARGDRLAAAAQGAAQASADFSFETAFSALLRWGAMAKHRLARP